MPHDWSHADLQEMGDFVKETTRKTAIQTSNSKLVCVVGQDGNGGYQLRTSDGFNIDGAIALDGVNWTSGTWVTAERSEQGWTIAGVGAYDGGTLPDESG